MKNKLDQSLPTNESEVLEKGFRGNVTKSKKFITDGHSMFLSSLAPKGMIFKEDDDFLGRPVAEKSIQECWDFAEGRKNVSAHFIGCARYNSLIDIAVVRDDQGRFVFFNPYILKFILTVTKADGLAVCPAKSYGMVVVLREGKMVGAVMPLRYEAVDLQEYDLNGPAINL